MEELTSGTMIGVIIISYLCEYIDSTIGMGYGTTLTPMLLLLGFSPIQIVPAVLLSELISGLLAGFFHHRAGNVNFKPGSINTSTIPKSSGFSEYVEAFKKWIPLHLRVALFLTFCSITGTIVAVLVAVNIPKHWLNLYIGCLVLSMGIVTIICLNRSLGFSWKKLAILGLIASFNKGISGGGYGPVVTGGQMLSGIESRSAIGITSLSEGLTCLVGVIAYLLAPSTHVDWILAPYIAIGAVASVPLSAISVKKIGAKRLKLIIAVITITLGTLTIVKGSPKL